MYSLQSYCNAERSGYAQPSSVFSNTSANGGLLAAVTNPGAAAGGGNGAANPPTSGISSAIMGVVGHYGTSFGAFRSKIGLLVADMAIPLLLGMGSNQRQIALLWRKCGYS